MDTEQASPRYADIDLWEPTDILHAMIEGQMAAVAAVRACASGVSISLPDDGTIAPWCSSVHPTTAQALTCSQNVAEGGRRSGARTCAGSLK